MIKSKNFISLKTESNRREERKESSRELSKREILTPKSGIGSISIPWDVPGSYILCPEKWPFQRVDVP